MNYSYLILLLLVFLNEQSIEYDELLLLKVGVGSNQLWGVYSEKLLKS